MPAARTTHASRTARRLALALLVASSSVLAACSGGAGDADDVVSGGRLTIYVSAPLRGPAVLDGQDIVDGAKLALLDAGAEAGGVDVEAIYMDDTGGEAGEADWDPVIIADNARRAAQDSTAIAYIGELESGATRISLPITNQAAMLQVSPGSSAMDLVRDQEGGGDVPELFQPSGERTFGRVIPGDDVQAAAGAVLAGELGPEGVAMDADESEFGELMAEEFEEAFGALGRGLAALGARGTITYFAGDGCPSSIDTIVIVNDSAIGSASCESAQTTARSAFFVTSAAQDPSQLPASGQEFVAAFEDAYDRKPGRYAAYGYEAMALVLDSIDRAGDPESRSSVIDAFFATEDRDSILGTYSIDALGQTTLTTLASYRLLGDEPQFYEPIEVP